MRIFEVGKPTTNDLHYYVLSYFAKPMILIIIIYHDN